ncbi:MAG: hypothetical protein FWH26_04165 [Oscillospiraceae bacterium]|nr:hypothetical protein [Oscillospiraceae bacterium]
MEQRTFYPWETNPEAAACHTEASVCRVPPAGFPPRDPGRQELPASSALTPPAYLLAHAFQADQVTLLWGASPQAEGYLLLRGETPEQLRPIAAVEEPSYIDTQVLPGTTYWYAVRAYGEAGQSAPAIAPAITLPAAPVAARDTPLELSQNVESDKKSEPAQNVEPDKNTEPKKNLEPKKSPEPEPEKTPAPKQEAGPEKESAPRLDHEASLETPVALQAATRGTRQIALFWHPSEGAEEYRVYRSLTPWCCYSLCAETRETRYLDAVPDAGTKYYYFIQAVRRGICSTASPMVEATTFPPLPEPEPPGRVRAVAVGSGAVELRWEHARGAAAYLVSARRGVGEEFKLVGQTLDDVFLHQDLPPDSCIDYRVQSYHDSGVSEPSLIASAKTAGLRAPAQSRGGGTRSSAAAGNNVRRFPSFSLQALNRGF